MAFDINSVSGFDAAAAHVASGAAIALGFSLFVPAYVAVLIAAGIAFTKEALEAIGIAPWEPKQSWSSSMIDFCQFLCGIGTAGLIFLIRH